MKTLKTFENFTLNEKTKCDTGSSKKTRKSSSRKSPTDSATCHDVGTEKKGNDGDMWVITSDKNGVNHWTKK